MIKTKILQQFKAGEVYVDFPGIDYLGSVDYDSYDKIVPFLDNAFTGLILELPSEEGSFYLPQTNISFPCLAELAVYFSINKMINTSSEKIGIAVGWGTPQGNNTLNIAEGRTHTQVECDGVELMNVASDWHNDENGFYCNQVNKNTASDAIVITEFDISGGVGFQNGFFGIWIFEMNAVLDSKKLKSSTIGLEQGFASSYLVQNNYIDMGSFAVYYDTGDMAEPIPPTVFPVETRISLPTPKAIGNGEINSEWIDESGTRFAFGADYYVNKRHGVLRLEGKVYNGFKGVISFGAK